MSAMLTEQSNASASPLVEEQGTVSAASPEEVFEQVFQAQRTFVERLFYYHYEDWQLSEDLAVEVFERLWLSLSSGSMVLTNPEHPRALLRKMADYVRWAYNKREMQKKDKPLRKGETALDSLRPALREAAAQLAVADEVAGESNLGAMLAMLPEKQRRAVALRYVADMDQAEVAEATGWPERTVKFHAINGLNALRAAAGLPTGGTRSADGARRREEIRRVYQESIEAGSPLTTVAMARTFSCSPSLIRKYIAGIDAGPAPTPIRERVRQHLAAGLADGTFPAGSLMPSSQDLAKQFDTLSGNVCPVFHELEAEHLVVKFAGRYYAGATAPAAPDPRATTSTLACRDRRSRTVSARIPGTHGRKAAGVFA